MGTFGLQSRLISFLLFKVFSLDDISDNNCPDGGVPGAQDPNREDEILSKSARVSSLEQLTSLPKKALTPSRTGSPRTLWDDLSPDWQPNENIATSNNSTKLSGKRCLELDAEGQLHAEDEAMMSKYDVTHNAMRAYLRSARAFKERRSKKYSYDASEQSSIILTPTI